MVFTLRRLNFLVWKMKSMLSIVRTSRVYLAHELVLAFLLSELSLSPTMAEGSIPAGWFPSSDSSQGEALVGDQSAAAVFASWLQLLLDRPTVFPASSMTLALGARNSTSCFCPCSQECCWCLSELPHCSLWLLSSSSTCVCNSLYLILSLF